MKVLLGRWCGNVAAYGYICDTSNTFLHKSFTLFLCQYSVEDIQTDFQNLQVCFCIRKKRTRCCNKMWHDTWILRKYFVTKSKGRSFCKIALVLIYIFRVFLWYFKGAQLHMFFKNQENRPLIFRLCSLPQKFFQLHTTQKEFHFFKVILLCSMFIFLWNLSSSGTGS